MAITALEAEKRLGQHLIEAANAINEEVAKILYASVLDLMELQRERFMTVTDAVGGDYRDRFVSWIKGGCCDDDSKLVAEWNAIFESMSQRDRSPYEAKTIHFPATYFYRTGQFGFSSEDKFALRIGWINVTMPAVTTSNPLEIAIRDYVVGITNDHKKVISAMTSQLRSKARSAVKNQSIQGVTNYIYNQYVKGHSGNPFVNRLIGLDLFTNEEIMDLYSGTASGTDNARQQVKYMLRGFAQELKHKESLAEYGVSGSLYNMMMTRFINEGEWSELYDLFTEDFVEQWNVSREFPIHRENSRPAWRTGIFKSIYNRLGGEAKTEFLQHCWDNVLSANQRDEVIAMTLDHFEFNLIDVTGAVSVGRSSREPFTSLVTETDVMDFFKKTVNLSPKSRKNIPSNITHIIQGITLADIVPVVIEAILDDRSFYVTPTPKLNRFEHLSGQRVRYIYSTAKELGPIAMANQAAIFAEGLVIHENDYYVIDEDLRKRLKIWRTMGQLITSEHMAKINSLAKIAHKVDACDYELLRYKQDYRGNLEILDINKLGNFIAFRK